MNKVLCVLFGHIWTKKDGKYGIVDITENTVLDFNYENISYIEKAVARKVTVNSYHAFFI